MFKVIRLKTFKGKGSKVAFVAHNITTVTPVDDNNSLVATVSDSKGVKVYESTDEICQMIQYETIGTPPPSNNISYPQLEQE